MTQERKINFPAPIFRVSERGPTGSDYLPGIDCKHLTKRICISELAASRITFRSPKRFLPKEIFRVDG